MCLCVVFFVEVGSLAVGLSSFPTDRLSDRGTSDL